MSADSRLAIPKEAIGAAVEAFEENEGWEPEPAIRAALDAAVPLIVATELERIADGVDMLSAAPGNVVLRAEAVGRREIRQVLLGRAAELRGGAK